MILFELFEMLQRKNLRRMNKSSNKSSLTKLDENLLLHSKHFKDKNKRTKETDNQSFETSLEILEILGLPRRDTTLDFLKSLLQVLQFQELQLSKASFQTILFNNLPKRRRTHHL